MSRAVLVLNAGSSSIKFTLFDLIGAELTPRYDGQIEAIDVAPHFVATDASGAQIVNRTWAARMAGSGHEHALAELSTWLLPLLPPEGLLGVGHRVVHGGPEFTTPTVIDDAMLERLARYTPLAPLHNPANLAGIAATFEHLPGVPQVACFDTAFHRSRPPVADRFAIPAALYAEGVRRYGFHGLSYEYIASALPEVAPEVAGGRVVVAHLGNGASMAALKAGVIVDSTMSFTALDGLAMGTRCGQLDAGVVLYLMQEKRMDAQQIETLLYKQSGLLGVSGISSDMRVLAASDDPLAQLAIDLFVYRVVCAAGALAAAMGGIDALVFTAGIGENAAPLRARVVADLAWLGIELDAAANAARGPRISTPGSRVAAYVISTDEELMIAQHTVRLLG